MTEAEQKLAEEAKGFITQFDEAMDDDFNTADAISAIFDLVKFANTHVSEEAGKAFVQAGEGGNRAAVRYLRADRR